MKIGIFSNFIAPSVGGSEFVIENISRILASDFGNKINIYGHNLKGDIPGTQINRYKCNKGDALISQINENDSILIYSDSFWGMDTVLKNLNKINCRVSVCLVGAYFLRSNPTYCIYIKENQDKFNLICHSNGEDYRFCLDNRLNARIIRNGVNLSEFECNKIDFRKKYNIREKNVLLNVSNFFYGKGQEYLPIIARKLNNYRDDFVIISISNTSTYPYDKLFFDRCESESSGLNIRFLRDLSREDVVASFLHSNLFLFTSRKEVAPLVLLESRAAKLQTISFDVGDAYSQVDYVIRCNEFDSKGYILPSEKHFDAFAEGINRMISFGCSRYKMVEDENIKEIDWSSIVPLYEEILKR